MKTLTLYELNQLVAQLISIQMDEEYWVEAELSEVREVRGHCYMELIQKDLLSPTPVARASAKCWKNVWTRLRPKFEDITHQQLHSGMKILIRVYASFHEAFGFSWIVTDINPEYTMGDTVRRRQEIISKLHEEGIFDMQKQLHLPLFAQRIAVVSSASAAGYGDFCNQLADNDYGFHFHTRLFPAIMQGEQVEQSIIAALNTIYDEADHFDAVVIIRGGGASADLSGFDTLALAENVAQYPLPIITGIGHDRDESIIDMVSHTRVKTPTAAAAFLIDHLAKTAERIEQAQTNIVRWVEHKLTNEQLRISRLTQRLPTLFTQVRTRREAQLDAIWHQLIMLTRQHVNDCNSRLTMLHYKLADARHLLSREQHRLQLLEQRTEALNPERLLQLGYSITLHNGHILRSPSQLQPGDEIETKLKNGTIVSVVK